MHEGLIRISAGCEAAEDLIADITPGTLMCLIKTGYSLWTRFLIIINQFSDFIWTYPMPVLLVSLGIWLTIKFQF